MAASPLSILRYLLDRVSPHLPYPVTTSLNLLLQLFDALPPAIANLLPLLLAAFAIYTSIISLYSTARYTVRTTWWLVKWATVIAVIAWAFGGGGGGGGKAPSSTNGNGILGTLYDQYTHFSGANGPRSGAGAGLGDFVQQAASSAGFDVNGRAAAQGSQGLGFLQSFIPDSCKGVVNTFSSFLESSSSSSSPASSTSRRRRTAGQDDLDDADTLKYTASWLSSIAGKAWDALNTNPEGDRWSESRNRRKAGTQKNR